MNSNFIRRVSIDWKKIPKDSYLKKINSINSLKSLDFNKKITCFTGENGSGKSTLLEAIAVAYGFNPEGGTLNHNFSTYDDVSELSDAVMLSKGYRQPKGKYFFRAESFFNLASKLEEYREGTPKEVFYERFGGMSLHEQSHGESFLSFFQTNELEGIYIMDEPEAALSPQSQLVLLIQIVKMANNGSQFIIATHSPILLGMPDIEIYSFDKDDIYLCRYEETECYKVMKLFLDDRNNFIKMLLEDSE